ncbi:disintegrin and metalloproteinase domain-containing protein 21-like [Sceloporus undulatus]|uniref:disintegrin and metalloproteinase domain-containing protein 21-like n=1 Tax=Sceloporus undulatus TaxID=8520 RepID=UPI001C4B25F6|nr:disintegrin and metalloproteinase domain-containing protein 21-like [Sceloporus undulatus]
MSGSGAPLALLLLGLGFVGASKYLYFEVIVPKELGPQTGFHSKKELSYKVRIEGVNRIVHLRQKSFIFRNMPVYSFDLKGNRREDHPYIKVDCYYRGYVEDALDSDVVLSTCTGLWGYIQIEGLKYEIQPVQNSPAFHHLIYRTERQQQEPCKAMPEEQDELANNEIQLRGAGEPRHVTEFPGARSVSRYLAYFAVSGHSLFQREEQNATRVILVILQVFSILHNIYEDIGLNIVLTGIELWTERDYLIISDKPSETLDMFYNYVYAQLWHQAGFDHAALFTIKNELKPSGKQWQAHSCLPTNVSVSVVKISSSLMQSGAWAAHQLGHAIGFVHDDLPRPEARMCDCNCNSKPGHCVMHSAVAECHRLSNCSKNRFRTLLARYGGRCFLNLPKDQKSRKICGNGVVEANEECDCGTDKACQRNGCCLQNCTWSPNASCSHGKCCERCKFVNEGMLCREATNKCDLPEYCTGGSGSCPKDTYKQDGTPCGTNNSCYLGECLDLHFHCRTLFGKDAKPAPLSCYKEVNMRGDRTGNCGKADLEYKKCKEEDVFCGRIQCINVKKIPIISNKQGVIQTPTGNILCLGTEFHEEEEMYDVGAIKDGSACGPGKICVNRSCVSRTILNYDCDFSKCNHQGVCNNNKNCHCAYGWAPPYCSSRGFGGSIDSGPPPEQIKSKKMLMLGSLLGVALLLVTIGIMTKKYIYAWSRFGMRQKLSPEPMYSSPEEDSSPEGDSAPENSELTES